MTSDVSCAYCAGPRRVPHTSSRRQRTSAPELGPLAHPRGHGGYDLEADDVLRNDSLVTRIPIALWLILYLVSMTAMVAVGYQLGAEHSRRWFGTAFLALAFATVLVTIADLDDGSRGFLRISQQPMEQLYENLL